MVQPLGVALDHALGQCCAHAIKLARAGYVLEARQRWLRGHIQTRNRIAVEQHLVHWIGNQTSRIVGVRITTGDGEDALREISRNEWSTLPVCRGSRKQPDILAINP